MTERNRSRTTGAFDKEVIFHRPEMSYSGLAGTVSTKRIIDELTPDFTSLLKCGEFLPLNPVYIITETESRLSSSCDIYPAYNPGYRLRGDVGGLAFNSSAVGGMAPPWPKLQPEEVREDLINAVVVSARANAVSDAWDVLTFMAELQSSVRTLATVSSRFWNASARLAETAQRISRKRGRLRKAGEVYDIFRNLWLEGRYGIRPMVYDAVDITNVIRKLTSEERSALITGKGYQRSPAEPSFEVETDQTIGNFYRERTTLEKSGFNVTYRGKAYIEAKGDWSDAFQADIFNTAWELTPYSFVFDWFVDVGSWISTLTPTASGSFAGTCVSYKYNASNTRSFIMEPHGPIGQGSGGRAYITRTVEHYVRFPYAGIPYPPVNVRLSIPKLIDLLTLSVNGRKRVNQILGRR